jgi:hypothetical protein
MDRRRGRPGGGRMTRADPDDTIRDSPGKWFRARSCPASGRTCVAKQGVLEPSRMRRPPDPDVTRARIPRDATPLVRTRGRVRTRPCFRSPSGRSSEASNRTGWVAVASVGRGLVNLLRPWHGAPGGRFRGTVRFPRRHSVRLPDGVKRAKSPRAGPRTDLTASTGPTDQRHSWHRARAAIVVAAPAECRPVRRSGRPRPLALPFTPFFVAGCPHNRTEP